ncbi:MAG TPA: Tol-Pal system protein TolB [Oceanospirillales bacterium]|nr:Tol-Pal system protein TolB [Oceanospirillales bacterium]|tara:strand:- start:410 stop:1693 length:1284 start_codon:yes stop_codon:yes gene_type:complete
MKLLVRLIFFSVLAMQARAELVIEITQGKQSAIPLAVVPFEWKGMKALPENVAQIVANDLGRSGYFNSLPTSQMLSMPNREEEIFYRDWQLLKQDYLVIGSIQDDGRGGYAINFKLVDVNTKTVLMNQKLTGGASALRDIAHFMSDRIFAALTGVPGAFSTKLVYVTTNRERTQFNLSYADADGAREQNIFSSKQPIISPAWSSDGKKLAYTSFENGRSEIFIQEIATGKREKIASFKGSNSAPAFSPDDTKMAMVLSRNGNPDIYVMDLSTRKLKRITKHYGIDTEPQWMPDGKNIIFTSSRIGKPQIYKVSLENLKPKRITFEGDYNARARVTPDGRKMVMVHRNGDDFHIAVQNLNTGILQVLTTETQLDESPSVAPNGSMVVYAASEGDRSILAAVSLDGDVKFRLPSKYGDVREPAWSPILN